MTFTTMYAMAPQGAGYTVNLRSQPNTTTSVVLKYIPHRSSVQAEYYDSTWHKVIYDGTTGYVMSTYLINPPLPDIGAGLVNGSTTQFDGTTINVRSAYVIDPTNILYTTVSSDDTQTLTVVGVSSPQSGYIWYKISNPNPSTTISPKPRPDGWVRGDYLKGTIR